MKPKKLLTVITLISLLGLASLPLHAVAGTFTAFGPEVYTRGAGSPVTVTNNFTLPNPNPSCTLEIHNGGLEDDGVEFENVSSSVIRLNGDQVVGPNEFNQNVRLIDKPVSLNTNNELSVEVRGKPGGALTVFVLCVDDDPPTITASIDPQPNAAGWHNTDPTVTFTCTGATSGIASCTAPVTVTTEGAGQVINGTATDIAGNSSSTSVTVNIDKTPPVITVTDPADGTVTNDAEQVFVGFLSEAASLTLNGESVMVGPAYDFSHGPVALLQGINSFQFVATDVADNTGILDMSVTLLAQVIVPDVFGLLLAEAEAALTEASLTAGDIIEAHVLTVPTGVVIGQDPVAGTDVAAGSAVKLALVQAPPVDEIVPDTWAGQWQLSITYRDPATGDTVNVTEITDVICPGDPLGLALLWQMFDALPDVTPNRCSSMSAQNRIEVVCAVQGSVDTCTFDGGMQFGMDLGDDALSGSGDWTLSATGCDPPPLSEGQTFILSGVRLSPDTAGLCAVPASSLLQKFMRNPLLPVMGVVP